MNRLAITCLLSAFAAAAQAESFLDNARVRSAQPQYESVTVPREACTSQWVNETRRVSGGGYNNGYGNGGPNYGGVILGGVAGGVLGNQVGKGHGREAATAIGAVVGALAGNHIAGNGYNYNQPDQYQQVPRQVTSCQTCLLYTSPSPRDS